MAENPSEIYCSPETVDSLIPCPHERPADPVCMRKHNKSLNALVAPPCAEIGYCVVPHLEE